jgi:hypothetical protein
MERQSGKAQRLTIEYGANGIPIDFLVSVIESIKLNLKRGVKVFLLGGAVSKAGTNAAFDKLEVDSEYSKVEVKKEKNGSELKEVIIVRCILLMDGSIVYTVTFVHGLIMPDYRYHVLCGLEIASSLVGKKMNPKVHPKILDDRHVFGPSIKDNTGKKKDVEAESTLEACFEDVKANGIEVAEDWKQHLDTTHDKAGILEELHRRFDGKIIAKSLAVHPLLEMGVGKASAQLMGAGSGVKTPAVNPVLLMGVRKASAQLMGAGNEIGDEYVAECDLSETITCSKVLTSEWAHLFSALGVFPKDSLLDQSNASPVTASKELNTSPCPSCKEVGL